MQIPKNLFAQPVTPHIYNAWFFAFSESTQVIEKWCCFIRFTLQGQALINMQDR